LLRSRKTYWNSPTNASWYGVATNNISGKRITGLKPGFVARRLSKNSGAGAAMMRIEGARRIFPRCWFNEKGRLKPDGVRLAITTSVATKQG